MKKKVICMIPARIGSQRFKQKNLALIKGKPVLAWGIESALKSKKLLNHITWNITIEIDFYLQVRQNLMMLFMIS